MSPFWHPEFFVCFLFRVSKILDPCTYIYICRSQWPRGLRRRSAAARLLRSWVRILPRTWMFVCCECCVLSRRGLWDELITRPEESYRLWCVVVCALETSRMRGPWPALSRSATEKKMCVCVCVCVGEGGWYTHSHTKQVSRTCEPILAPLMGNNWMNSLKITPIRNILGSDGKNTYPAVFLFWLQKQDPRFWNYNADCFSEIISTWPQHICLYFIFMS